MGRPWCHKWAQIEQNEQMDFLALPFGNLFKTLSAEKLDKHVHVFLCIEASLAVFYGCSFNFGELFQNLLRLLVSSGIGDCCYPSFVKSQIPAVRGFDFLLMLTYFSPTLPERLFCNLLVFSGFTFRTLFAPKVVLGWTLEAS